MVVGQFSIFTILVVRLSMFKHTLSLTHTLILTYILTSPLNLLTVSVEMPPISKGRLTVDQSFGNIFILVWRWMIPLTGRSGGAVDLALNTCQAQMK